MAPDLPGEIRVSEVFESIQGEGPSAGSPCMFVRLAACNLRCTWCDTPYTWDWQRFDYDQEVARQGVEQVATRVRASQTSRLVITGGEPMIQQHAISRLLALLPRELVVEVETNGTFAPEPALAERVDQWNVSPKLASGGDAVRLRIKPAALAALRDTGRAWLKLVVDADRDMAEAEALIGLIEWPRERVLLMPEARSRDELAERLPGVQRAAAQMRVGVSSRLHLTLWDGERGR